MNMLVMGVLGDFSTGVSELDDGLSMAISLMAGVVAFLGVYKLVIGVKNWSDANEEMDQARKSQGLNTIVSGVIMISVAAILAIFGITI